MALPSVNITIKSGGLGRVPLLSDGVAGLLITGELTSVPTINNSSSALQRAYDTPVQLGSVKDLEALSLEPESNSKLSHALIQRHVKDFYNTAGDGAQLYLMLLPKSGTAASFTNIFAAGGPAEKMVEQSSGRLRLLGVAHRTTTSTATDGLKYDLHDAATQGQSFATRQLSAARPLSIIVAGDEADLSSLKDYAGGASDRVSMLVSSTSSDKRAAVGLVLGRLSQLPVQRSLARVKNGTLPVTQAYFTDGKTAEEQMGTWETLNDKRYIFFRSYTGLAGYYISNDLALVANTNDTATIALGRTIDKAVRLTYSTYIEEIAEEVLLEDGKLAVANVKYLESKIENVINETMVNASELSSVRAIIDPEQNILSTSKLDVDLRLVPVGYAKQISVQIGFKNPQISS